MRILIVDDDEELAGLLSELLTREGFRVDMQHDGPKGLATALGGGYDLMVLDVMLPGMDGFTICGKVREAKNFTPILFLTAKNTDDDRVHGFETGADDYLGKPFQVRELLLRVRAILRRESWYKSREISSRQAYGSY